MKFKELGKAITQSFTRGEVNKLKQFETQDNDFIAYDKDGNTLYQEDVVNFLKQELERRKNERRPLELNWNLNCNFLAGNQFCDINVHRSTVEQYYPVYDYLEHEVFNQIAPIVETRIANLRKLDFLMTVLPATDDPEDSEKAQISTALLRRLQKTSDFEKRKDNILLWSELCGSSFILSWWNKDAGDLCGYDPDGQPLFSGDVEYGLLSPYEVYPESIFKESVADQRSIIIEQVMNADDIAEKYGVKIKGREIDTFSLTPVDGAGGFGYEASVMSLTNVKKSNCGMVVTYFERKSKLYPEGRLIIMIDDHIISYGPLPYNEIPLVAVKSKNAAGQFFGKSIISELIPLQRAYNGCMNSIHDYIKSLTIGGWIAEDGSVDLDEFEENGTAPGSILTYRKGYNPPVPIGNASLPEAVTYECQKLKSDMEYAAGVSQLMVIGATPTGVTSGKAIESLRDIDSTRLSLVGENIRSAMLCLARIWLSIIKQHISGTRVLKIAGRNSVNNVVSFCADDINSFDVCFDTQNELALSREMQREEFLRAYSLGLFNDEHGKVPCSVKQRILELMNLSHGNELSTLDSLQISAAKRENNCLQLGFVPEVSDIDDHSIHIEEHTRRALQADFALLKSNKPELCNEFLQHIKKHKECITLQNQFLNREENS